MTLTRTYQKRVVVCCKFHADSNSIDNGYGYVHLVFVDLTNTMWTEDGAFQQSYRFLWKLWAYKVLHVYIMLSKRIAKINSSGPSMRQNNISAYVQIMVCRLFGAKPLSEPKLPYGDSYTKKYISMTFDLKFKRFSCRKCPWKYRLQNGGHFDLASIC